MGRFRKKPVVISAEQWYPDREIEGVQHGLIETLEGTMAVSPGDWVITGVKGEIYSCKPDIFEASYEAVDESDEHTHIDGVPFTDDLDGVPFRYGSTGFCDEGVEPGLDICVGSGKKDVNTRLEAHLSLAQTMALKEYLNRYFPGEAKE